MNLQDFLTLLGIAGYFISANAVKIHAQIKESKARTKNNNQKLLLGWADQAVTLVERLEGIGGNDKKAQAVDYVAARLSENKLAKKFSQEQLHAAVEMAVDNMNQNKEGK